MCEVLFRLSSLFCCVIICYSWQPNIIHGIFRNRNQIFCITSSQTPIVTNKPFPTTAVDTSEKSKKVVASGSGFDSPLFNGQNPWIARILLLIVSSFYGSNFGCVKILDDALAPSVAAALRFTLAASVFSPNVLKVVKTNPTLILGGLEVGAYCFIGYWAQAISLQTSQASTAAFICSLSVIVVPLLDSLFVKSKSKLSGGLLLQSLLPALLAATGVAFLEVGGSIVPGVGDLWAFLQPLFFGFSYWKTERFMKSASQPGEAQAFTGSLMSVVAVGSIIWTLGDFVAPLALQDGIDGDILATAFSSQIHAISSNWHVIAALAWTGIVTTALTIYVENIALRSLKAAEATVILSTEPLWGAAFASAALGEQLGWNTFAGALFILTACLWSSLVGPKLAPSLS